LNRKALLLFGVFLAVGGCVTVKPVTLPNGKAGHAITCDTAAQCMNEAAKLCGGPYQVLHSQTNTAMANGYGGSETEMVVECGEAAPASSSKS
jgi:hypothetical protein